MLLSIIIVNYNTAHLLTPCLLSIQKHIPLSESEVCVVDNASADNSLEILRRDFPWVKTLSNPKNLGFGAGINRGVQNTSGRFILWLNPDTEILDSGITPVMRDMDLRPETGITGLQILNPDRSLQLSARSFPSYETALFSRYSLLTRLFPGNPWSTRYLKTDWDHESAREVDWVSGSVLLHKRKVWEDLGGLDERFFMYCEDVDFCLQAKARGWKVLYDPRSRVVHSIGGSSRKISRQMLIEHHKSMGRYYAKNYTHHFFKDFAVGSAIWGRCFFLLLLSLFKSGRNHTS